MENNIYTFDKKPEDHQPSNCCDFSKMYNPKTAIVTYTNVDTRETETHTITKTDIIDNNVIKKMIYTLPPPFIKR